MELKHKKYAICAIASPLEKNYLDELSKYSEEWATLIPMIMMPKCDMLGYCPETYSCGRKPKKES